MACRRGGGGRDPGREGRGGAGRGADGGGGCGRGGEVGGGGCLEEGAYLVAGDGFLFEQGGGELVECVVVAGEQVGGAGFGLGEQGGDFLVEQPLGVLGVAARGGAWVAGDGRARRPASARTPRAPTRSTRFFH